MSGWLRLALVVAYLGAAALPCAQRDADSPSLAERRAYAAGAFHTHGALPDAPDGELRAPCACGCDEAPADVPGSARLGAALLPAAPAATLPRAQPALAGEPLAHPAPTRLPEPVPRLA